MNAMQITVLVVDDSASIRALLRQILEQCGYRACEAGDGLEALACLAEQPIDVVLTDLQMPNMDGLTLIAALHERAINIPIIVVSADGSLASAMEAIHKGAWDYLQKPIHEEAVLIAMDHVLNRMALLEENRCFREQMANQVQLQTLEIRAGKERYRRLLESVTSYVYTVTVDRGVAVHTAHSCGCETVTGYTPEEYDANHDLWYRVVHDDDRDRVIDMARRMLVEVTRMEIEHRIIHKNGSIRWIRNVLVPSLAPDGVLRCYDGIITDITERKQAEERQKRHADNLASLHTIDLAITGSLDLRITLKVLLNEIINRLKVDAACVLLMDPHTRTLEYMAGSGFEREADVGLRSRTEKMLAGRACVDQCSIVISDTTSCPSQTENALRLVRNGFRAYVGVPLIAKGQVKGVLEIFCRLPLTTDPEWLEFVEALGTQAAIAIDNAELFDELQLSHNELVLAYDTTIEGLSRAMDFRDKETEGHSRRVTDLTVRLAREAGFDRDRLAHVRRGALLHDIGKLGVPDSILLKPGPLTADEFAIMKRHTEIAFSILSPIEFLRPALDIPCNHHEKWDGSGYPRGLKGEEIPLAARIFSIVDVWDALCSDRPYRAAWSSEKARAHICSQSGIHFDPALVSLFEEIVSLH